MNAAAADWTAIGSIAGGFGAIAAFLAILATIAVYIFQSRGDKATAIRQNLQFLHGQQIQVVPSIESGLPAMIDRQVREFRDRLGPSTEPSYFLDKLFSSRDRSLFRASALDSNLSSSAYARIIGLCDGLSFKAFEFRGVLRIFAYACEALTEEISYLFSPEFTASILGVMEKHGDRRSLGKIHDLDELINTLLSSQIEIAERQFKELYKERIGQGCYFIGMLADLMLRLPDKDLLAFARRNVPLPRLEDLKEHPHQAMSTMLDHLASKLQEKDLRALRDVLDRWYPQSMDKASVS